MTCANCHPDGRTDGMTWMTPGGPRQTPILVGRLGTDPHAFNWRDPATTLLANIVQTATRLRIHLKPEDARSLERYLRGGHLPRMVNPHSVTSVAATVARGKALFNDPAIGCANCHVPSTGFTDGLAHDVGTRTSRDLKVRGAISAGEFNTPSLIGLWASAPYLHDGGAPTLNDVFTGSHRDQMSGVLALVPADRTALIAYLKTL